jgi:hypothetical protein
MTKEQDLTKMEFLLTLNDRIIVQRFYNVKGFNLSAKNSLELYEFIKDVKDDLELDLKNRTVTYMIDNINQIMEDENVLNTSMTDGEEHFNLFIKIGDETLCHRQFNAKLYPPKIRYTVDVRPYLKSVLKGLTDIFSGQNLTYEYLDLPLSV